MNYTYRASPPHSGFLLALFNAVIPRLRLLRLGKIDDIAPLPARG